MMTVDSEIQEGQDLARQRKKVGTYTRKMSSGSTMKAVIHLCVPLIVIAVSKECIDYDRLTPQYIQLHFPTQAFVTVTSGVNTLGTFEAFHIALWALRCEGQNGAKNNIPVSLAIYTAITVRLPFNVTIIMGYTFDQAVFYLAMPLIVVVVVVIIHKPRS